VKVGSLAAGVQPHRGDAWSRAPIRVAIVDDDSGFLQVVAKRVEARHWECRVLAAVVPVDSLVAMRLHAVVIDLSLAHPAAWSYVEALCARLPGLGLVVCTRPASVSERVRGLRLGVDDWISKPCHPEELIARVEAVVRRRKPAGRGADHRPIAAGELEIRADRFQAFVREVPAELTRREFELLALLARSPGEVLERDEIYQRVWGYTMVHGDRSVDVYVRKLRQKLELVSPGWRYIHTHFGIGYRFAAQRAGPPPADETEIPSSLLSRGDMECRRDELLEVMPS
jgi:DNA-binding response OmpR family regulator